MSNTAAGRLAQPTRRFEPLLRNARLGSGLVLMVFVALHFVNHALNLISLEAAETGRHVFLALWRNPVGTLLLYGSLLIHIALTLFALYRRRTLAMPPREWAQVLLGLAIPLLIAEHVVGTRVLHELYGISDTYEYVARSLWIATPAVGVRQAVAVVVIWAHGCLGLYFWLRYRSWYQAAAPWLLVLAVLVPTFALLGFVHAGQAVSAMEQASATIDSSVADQAVAMKQRIDGIIYVGFAAIVAFVLAARLLRDLIERRNLVEVRYASGQSVRVPRGYSILDASRLGGIPHYAVCGGRGRCSTCRIRVLEGFDELPPPGPIEAATLRRIEAAPDVRLACQLKPDAPLKVAPLLMPSLGESRPALGAAAEPGHEKVLAIMFCDMRGFTALSDRRLPYDVVFLLNRYFALIGTAVERSGGHLDKFIGDGALAIFGLETSPGEASRQAVAAARAIIGEVRQLSQELSDEIGGQIRLAIGIHVGQAIVGTMGYGAAMGLTAIGDTVNIGSRLESLAKERDADIVISEAAVRLTELDFSAFPLSEIEIRGRARPLRVRIVPRGASVPAAALPEKSRGARERA